MYRPRESWMWSACGDSYDRRVMDELADESDSVDAQQWPTEHYTLKLLRQGFRRPFVRCTGMEWSYDPAKFTLERNIHNRRQGFHVSILLQLHGNGPRFSKRRLDLLGFPLAYTDGFDAENLFFFLLTISRPPQGYRDLARRRISHPLGPI